MARGRYGMASTWFENSPMVIQEAFIYGRPVAIFGGMAEKIQDGHSGLLVDPGSVEPGQCISGIIGE